MANCAKCGAVLAAGATFCGSCGTPVAGAAGGSAPAAGTGGSTGASAGLASNVGGALAYVTLIPPIIFLVVEPYNRDKFIKFHSFQSIFFHVAAIVLWVATLILTVVVGLIPVLGWIIDILLWVVLGFGLFGLWLFLLYQAYNNQKFMLPVIGHMAEQQAAK